MVPRDSASVTVFSYGGRFVSEPWPRADALIARLSPARRERLDRLRSSAEWALQVAALRVLEIGMERCGHGDFRLCDIVQDAGKKPVWRKPVDFSIAHAKGMAVVAISADARVGVDVEPVGVVSVRIAERLMSRSAASLPPLTSDSATERWTQVEAIVKAAGAGVFRAVDIEWRSDSAALDGAAWWWRPLSVGERHVAHVAADSPQVSVRSMRIDDL
jgi:phosphopantetheinyl transferase